MTKINEQINQLSPPQQRGRTQRSTSHKQDSFARLEQQQAKNKQQQ